MEHIRQVKPYLCLWIWFIDNGQIVNPETAVPPERLLPKVEEIPYACFSPSTSCHRPPSICPFGLKSLIFCWIESKPIFTSQYLPHQVRFLLPSSPRTPNLARAAQPDANLCLIQPSSNILAITAYRVSCVCVCIIWLFAYLYLPQPWVHELRPLAQGEPAPARSRTTNPWSLHTTHWALRCACLLQMCGRLVDKCSKWGDETTLENGICSEQAVLRS